MPKELNIAPNERIDFNDFTYGTRTFTVDSLRSHVVRLMSGGYRGGFVLEGFRVHVPENLNTMSVSVTNGIAIDRGGRIITTEEGDLFLNNPYASKDVDLFETAEKNYIMIEFSLEDTNEDQRAFWDPTYPNAAVLDSDGDSVPQPKGKEFKETIPTRKARSWTVINSPSGFEDTADPNMLRIPIAIIPINTSVAPPAINLVHGTDTTYANTTIIEQPVMSATAGLQYVRCANTRLMGDTGVVQFQSNEYPGDSGSILTRDVNTPSGSVTNVEYIGNDRENNTLSFSGDITTLTTVDPSTGVPYDPIMIGDRVETISEVGGGVAKRFLRDSKVGTADRGGSPYDCRPLFFAFMDRFAGGQEYPGAIGSGVGTGYFDGDPKTESRNYRYWSGASLLENPELGGKQLISYDNTDAYLPPDRTENRIKQNQDFFRILAVLMQEMKYGVGTSIVGTWSEAPLGSATLASLGIDLTTLTGHEYLIDTTKTFSRTQLDNDQAVLKILSGVNAGKTSLVNVVGAPECGVLQISNTAAMVGAFSSGDQYVIEIVPGLLGKDTWVDNYKVGTLQEVYDGRVNRHSFTYAQDLPHRLAMDRIPVMTVGDGIKTTGDYTGNSGLLAALNKAWTNSAWKKGGIIYVREGNYTLNAQVYLGSNVQIVGEGIDTTRISFTGGTVTSSNYFIFRDYDSNCMDPATATYAGGTTGVRVRGVKFKDITLEGEQHHPLISNTDLFRYSNSTTPVPGAGVLTDGVMIATGDRKSGAGTASGVTTLLEDIEFERVKIVGGGYGNFRSWQSGNTYIGDYNPVSVVSTVDVDKTATYAVNILSDEQWLTQNTNSNIIFKDCEFVNKGGVGLFKSCFDINFDGCTFSTLDPDSTSAPVAGVEGITFTSRQTMPGVAITQTDAASAAGWAGLGLHTLDSSGATTINNCLFLGWFVDSNITSGGESFKRGWVNFTPAYSGPNSVIQGTRFLLDVQGESALGNTSPIDIGVYPGDSDPGGVGQGTACVYKGSLTPLSVVNCEFNTSNWGVITQMGATYIKSSRFFNCNKGILVAGVRTPYPSTTGLAGNTAYYREWGMYYKSNFLTEITDCSFTGNGDNQPSSDVWSVGVSVDAVDLSSALSQARLRIAGCSFNHMAYGVETQMPWNALDIAGTTASADMPSANVSWENITIESCEFRRLVNPVLAHDLGVNNYDLWQTDATKYVDFSEVIFWVQHFEFINNSISKIIQAPRALPHAVNGATPYPGTSSLKHAAYVQLSAKNVIIKGTRANDIRTQLKAGFGVKDHLALFSTYLGSEYEFSNNTITNFYGFKTVLNEIYFCSDATNGIESTDSDWTNGPVVNINNNHYNNNKLVNDYSDVAGLSTNGFWFGVISRPYTSTKLLKSDQQEIRPNLLFDNNTLMLHNMNFGLVADQQYGTTSADDGGAPGIGGAITLDQEQDEIWCWGRVSVCSNQIQASYNLAGATPVGNLQYGNDLGFPLALAAIVNPGQATVTYPASTGNYMSYLGATYSALPTKYIAAVDLRRCVLTKGVHSGPITSAVKIIGNTIEFGGETALAKEASPDLREVMGVRISSFSAFTDIKDNTFIDAPLILEWKYKNPWCNDRPTPYGGIPVRSVFDEGGYQLDVCNNTIASYNKWHAVLISPVTGFGDLTGSFSATYEAGVLVNFRGNDVRCSDTSLNGTLNQAGYEGVINRLSFWHFTKSAAGYNGQALPVITTAGFTDWGLTTAAGGYSILQRWGKYLLNIKDNSVYNSVFYLTESSDGGDGTSTELDTAAGLTTSSANGFACWITIQDNVLTFKAGSVADAVTLEGSILGLPNKWDPAIPGKVAGGARYGHVGAGVSQHDRMICTNNVGVISGNTFYSADGSKLDGNH